MNNLVEKLRNSCEEGLLPETVYEAADAIESLIAANEVLQERRCEVCGYAEHHREHTGCLRKQVERLEAENAALKDLAKDAATVRAQAFADAAAICKAIGLEGEGLAGEVWAERCASAILAEHDAMCAAATNSK